jgi:hypothetical protein
MVSILSFDPCFSNFVSFATGWIFRLLCENDDPAGGFLPGFRLIFPEKVS